ncbi:MULTISPECIES: RelA/SpoT domain-containing protein [Pantoea]|uniref:RelA/SpoT domain-containing protein n=1 Tax=Pantoea TaxID=53335 RepID=UPI00259A1791|nr:MULTISPECIES: RelA/SpoT domain-containing protein [Pantoea]
MSNLNAPNINNCIDHINRNIHLYELFNDKIISIINRDKRLKSLIHSFKNRFKDEEHLRKKIIRKNLEDLGRPAKEQVGPITPQNIMNRITDICGVRIIHLYQAQFESIHQAIMDYVEQGEIFLYEQPKAYTWDPEYRESFSALGLDSILRGSLYTSVHYVVKPRADSDVTCEIQVRTLFEEAWGEIDHTLNYPTETNNIAVQEQLKVLARIVGAGTRLSNAIFKISEAS